MDPYRLGMHGYARVKSSVCIDPRNGGVGKCPSRITAPALIDDYGLSQRFSPEQLCTPDTTPRNFGSED